MAIHSKTRHESTPLSQRIARARTEDRTQQALELARQLFKQEPTAEHKQLLQDVTLERGAQLSRQGHAKDAVQVYTNALNLDLSLETKIDVVRRLAELGVLGPSIHMAATLGDAPEKPRLLGAVVDGVMRLGTQGKQHLTADLHPAFDAIWQAFAHVEKGEDDAARIQLQAIGLQSPFLEWKVLLRGLMAYYANDNVKARENWQRLDPQRTPFAIASLFRVRIDADFRKLQSPEKLQAIDHVLENINGSGLIVPLRNLQKVFADPKKLADAFRMTSALLPALQKEHPHLVPRLAHCFFWAIIEHGQPQDVDRYSQTFLGNAKSTPELIRLQALATQRRGLDEDAHELWQAYERFLADNVAGWPTGDVAHMRALIWDRVGSLIQEATEAGSPVKFEPDAEACFKASIKLMPQRLAPHLALFEMHRRNSRATTKALAAGKTLLKHFPDHAATLEAMGDLELAKGNNVPSVEYYQRAMQANPLERRLRNKLGQACFAKAMDLAFEQRSRKQSGAVEDFRPHIEKALALVEGTKTHLLCRWAFLERRHGDEARAQQLEADALAAPNQRLAVRYALLCEAARARYKPAERKPFVERLTQEMQVSPSAEEVLALLETAALERVPAFTNQAAIEKNARDALRKFNLNVFSEAQLEALCLALQRFDAIQLWQQTLKTARRRFKKNPFFVLSEFDLAEMRERKGSDGMYLRNMDYALEIARSLVDKLPREQQEQYAKEIQKRQEIFEEIDAGFVNPFLNFMGGLPKSMLDMFQGFADDE